MKPHLNKNIAALIAAIFIFPAALFSNIVYTNLKPDVIKACEALFTTCIKSYRIDMDKNGSTDFELVDHIIFIYGVGEEMVKLRTRDNNQLAVDRTDLYARAFPQNAVIGSAERWVVDTSWGNVLSETTGGPYTGHWMNDVIRFLGVRLKKGNEYYYGWIRVAVRVKTEAGTGFAAFRIFDYAINDTPGEPIIAGQLSANRTVDAIAVDDVFAEKINEYPVFKVVPNPVMNGILNIACNSGCPSSADLQILNMNGELVYRERAVLTPGCTKLIHLSTLPSGYYYLKIIAGNKRQSIKFEKIGK